VALAENREAGCPVLLPIQDADGEIPRRGAMGLFTKSRAAAEAEIGFDTQTPRAYVQHTSWFRCLGREGAVV
jgi:hypothetical protein